MKQLFTLLLALMAINVVRADSVEDFNLLVDDFWAWEVAQYPERATHLGVEGANDRWTDLSLAGLEARDTRRAGYLEALAAIDPATLPPDDQLSHAMLTRRLEEARLRQSLGLNLMSMNMREGPQHRHTILEYTPMQDESDYRDWLARMEGIPLLLDQHTSLLQEGIKLQRVQPRAVMERVPAQLNSVITANPEDSPYYKPFREMPDTIEAKSAQQMQAQARTIIAEQITPAFGEFRDFFVTSYLPASREHPGVGSLPGGKDIYRYLASQYTTTDLTPEAIHQIGKDEVARILVDMEAVKQSVDFEGDLNAFNDFLRSDPRFYYDSPEALLEGYRAITKRIDPELVKLFGKLPRMPYGVKPIPMEIAPDTTTAYYNGPASNGTRAGYYYVNLYRPEVRPKYEMEVLSVHEAMPGHHLQIALAQELEGVPDFRKHSGVTAFIEGWGLYSENLGYQLGLYEDPYSKYGQLTYDMWRAVRLVVDTGMHYFGWSRQQAIDYFMANAGKSEADIINEIDRYIGWPGQALAYKIGQLKILELRARAKQTLGEDFDIRAFHDQLLGAGAIPLDALEVRMDAWILQQQDSSA
jgi:prolyl oligopeptidase